MTDITIPSIKSQFCTYEQSMALKTLGFEDSHLAWYQAGRLLQITYPTNPSHQNYMREQDCTAPLKQQAFQFFRERFGLHSYIEGAYPWFRYCINSDDDRWEGFKYLTFEESESACIDMLISIVKL